MAVVGAWSAALQGIYTIPPEVSDLELTCLSGGKLKSPLINSLLDERPVCPYESDSTIRCSQSPAFQDTSILVVDTFVSFQCHGTNPDQLVGQATLFNTTYEFSVGAAGTEVGYATQLMVLQAVVAETSVDEYDSDCPAGRLFFKDSGQLICGSDALCTSDGVNPCEMLLEGRTETQQDPVNKKFIHDVL